MPKAARKLEPVVAETGERPARAFKKQRFNVFLVTDDDTLWPLVGADLSGDLILKQWDSVDELTATVPGGHAGIVLWDARGQANAAATLSKLSLHSSRFVVVVLDNNAAASSWTLPLQQRQIVAFLAVPIVGASLGKALESAREEIGARLALLGSQPDTLESSSVAPDHNRWLPVAIGAGVVGLALAAALLWMRGGGVAEKTDGSTAARPPALPAAGVVASETWTPGKSTEAVDEKVDGLIEKAQQAMSERHFIDPAAGSALNLYRDVLVIDPNNGEARQGLQRLQEILVVRVQSALDDHKFDQALQFLETARSINAADHRLEALDERIASLRAELGPAQITAALNAQNFDRAAQLIDDAARAKSLPPAKLAQLRDDLRKRREDSDMARVLKMIDARLQQGRLVDPRNDSAAYYIEQARQAGAAPATLQPAYQELQRQLALAVRGAVDAKHFADAERWLADMREAGASSVVTTGLQKDLIAARSVVATPAASTVEQPSFQDLAQTRLSQGKLLEPDNDSALYYVNQLRASDPRNPALPQLSASLQEQILESGRAALDAGDLSKAQSLQQAAAGLGPSPSLDAFGETLRQKTMPAVTTPAAPLPQVAEQALMRLNKLEVVYPQRALDKGVEGWVEIEFTVNPDGTVGDVRAANASPPNVFEQAGIQAVSRMRYQPVLQGGKVVAVHSELRVVFRIPN